MNSVSFCASFIFMFHSLLSPYFCLILCLYPFPFLSVCTLSYSNCLLLYVIFIHHCRPHILSVIWLFFWLFFPLFCVFSFFIYSFFFWIFFLMLFLIFFHFRHLNLIFLNCLMSFCFFYIFIFCLLSLHLPFQTSLSICFCPWTFQTNFKIENRKTDIILPT